MLSALKLTSKACGSLALVNMTPIELIETWLNGCTWVACNVSLGKKRGLRGYTQATEAWASQATWRPMEQSEFLITEHDAIIDVIGFVPLTNPNIYTTNNKQFSDRSNTAH